MAEGGGTASSARIRLRELLSMSIKLCSEACGIIRGVQEAREAAGGQDSLEAQLKDASDPRSYMTVADRSAQHHIVSGLRAGFGSALDIVGEEEEETEGASSSLFQASPAAHGGSWWDPTYVIPPDYEEVVLADVCVFVDPLDGTREFVEVRTHLSVPLVESCATKSSLTRSLLSLPTAPSLASPPPSLCSHLSPPLALLRSHHQGRLEAVQCLVGVAYRGRPIAGIIGIPFLHTSHARNPGPSRAASCVHLLYGVVESPSGVAGLPLPRAGGACAVRSEAWCASAQGEQGEDGERVGGVARLAISKDLGRGTAVQAVGMELFGGGEEEWEGRGQGRLVVAGGCGYKILKVLTGEAVGVNPKP
jgi:hypothetical protein